MVRVVNVSVEEWQYVGEINYYTFSDFLVEIIGKYLQKYEDCDNTKVILPNCTTKAQRFNIHKLSTSEFKSNSYDDSNGDRIMEISLSKNLVRLLFKEYDFTQVVEATPPPVTVSERQTLFNNFVTFITQNFNQEFQEYLNNI